jgi:adenosylcobinamide amidohydrolase
VIAVTLVRPWLVARLVRVQRVLSWAMHNPGFVMTDRVVWREVRNKDLPIGFDVEPWYAQTLAAAGYGGAVAMLTSRDIGTYRQARSEVDGVVAECVATVGLTNGEAVGRRRDWRGADFGTINMAVATSAALTETAQLEALSIAVQARTAAVIAAGVEVPTGRVSGTGTDCLALACDAGATRYAGLHTPVAEAIGAAVLAAVTEAAADWAAWYAAETARRST